MSAKLDEMCALERGLGEEDPVVGNDADLVAIDAGEAFSCQLHVGSHRSERKYEPVTSVVP